MRKKENQYIAINEITTICMENSVIFTNEIFKISFQNSSAYFNNSNYIQLPLKIINIITW